MTDKPDAGELLPCPFCGEGVHALSRYHPRDPNEWYVSCGAKDCVMQPETPTYRTEVEAIAAWNRRSPSRRIEELEKALREIACFDDKPANAHLATYGTFGGFDEPGSVEIARAALSPSGGGEMAQPQTASRSPASERSAK